MTMPQANRTVRKTIQDARIIYLSAEDQLRFAELLLNPPPLSPAMERARDAHARLVRKPEFAKNERQNL